jgi:radical SAM superfamily enzyme YgiQ (UPF0313 family)
VSDLTLLNLNMLFMRYGQEIERERHVPLGCLYLTSALEQAGISVDFRDYQLVEGDDPFDMERFLAFMDKPAPVVGLSCMANLLPFAILAMKAIRQRWPDRKLILGGVGSKCVEQQILSRFGWINVICRGEGELAGPQLVRALRDGGDLSGVRGISWRDDRGAVHHNPDQARIADLDASALPAFDRIDLRQYAGYGMMTSRGCPYLCTFCSVAPVWNWETHHRSPRNIVAEMRLLHEKAGVDLFLFQDEFFISGKKQVMDFCGALASSGLKVQWKAFGRVNLTDVEMMQAMADCGCLELRFGIESGSDRILTLIKKGFTAAQTLDLIPRAVEIFPRVDTFYVWGYPFETMEDFGQSLFQMVSFRSMGARILPSLLSLLPQTQIYQEWKDKAALEFCPWLLPEFVFTGHEVVLGGEIAIPPRYAAYFDLIMGNPDIFPGFFHIDLKGNVLPKLAMLREFGFYPAPKAQPAEQSQGAELATRR